jgi:hypothetical protein
MKKILIILGLFLCPHLALAQSNRNPCVYITQPNCLAVGYYLAGSTGAPMPVGGIANAAAPTFTEGLPGYLSFDLSGNLRTAGSVSLTFPTIGAAVPATGVYNAINVAGTLRGWSGLPTGTLFPGAVAIVDASGNQITTFGGAATTSNASSGIATSSTNQANVVWNYGFNGTTWDQLQVDSSKFLKIVLPAETTKVIGTVNQGTSPWVISGALTANQSVNVSQINGITPLMGNGITGTGSQRVTIASDNTAFSVNAIQSGTWNINNISGTISLPNGAATSALQSTINTTLGAPFQAGGAIGASENHIGEVGGNIIPITNSMTTSNATVTTGQSIGGIQTLSNSVRVSGALGASGTSGIIQSVVLTFLDAVGSGPLDIYFYNATVTTGSNCANATTFVLQTADRPNVLGIAHVTDFTSSNTAVVAQANNLAIPFGIASGTSMFACVVARASFAITGTSNASLKVNVLRN